MNSFRHNVQLSVFKMSEQTTPGMPDLAPKWVRLVINGEIPGHFQIRFQYSLARYAGFVLFRANLTHFWAKSDTPLLHLESFTRFFLHPLSFQSTRSGIIRWVT